MDRDVTNRGPAICLGWVSRIFNLSFVSRNSSIYFVWFLVINNRHKGLGGLTAVGHTQCTVDDSAASCLTGGGIVHIIVHM